MKGENAVSAARQKAANEGKAPLSKEEEKKIREAAEKKENDEIKEAKAQKKYCYAY